ASSSARGSEAVASFIGYSKFVYLDEHASGRSLLATDAGIVATIMRYSFDLASFEFVQIPDHSPASFGQASDTIGIKRSNPKAEFLIYSSSRRLLTLSSIRVKYRPE
ncbi:MAG: hypothetical protein M3Q07_00485, partial [Pseudobdellovibrionaceae bacterium]|nr:hypothetical protein [Pseudobdellovibrionaceae bacterium]